MEQDQLILLLRNNERSAFIYLYDTFYPLLARYIQQHGGTKEDAEDFFQETIIVFMRNIKKDSFQLSSSLKTYLYAINKNLWLKNLRTGKPVASIEEHEEVLSEQDFQAVEEYRLKEQQQEGWLHELVNKVSQHCIILITRIFFKNNDSDVIIQELGYRNAHSFNNQKYKCLLQLRKEGKKMSASR